MRQTNANAEAASANTSSVLTLTPFAINMGNDRRNGLYQFLYPSVKSQKSRAKSLSTSSRQPAYYNISDNVGANIFMTIPESGESSSHARRSSSSQRAHKDNEAASSAEDVARLMPQPPPLPAIWPGFPLVYNNNHSSAVNSPTPTSHQTAVTPPQLPRSLSQRPALPPELRNYHSGVGLLRGGQPFDSTGLFMTFHQYLALSDEGLHCFVPAKPEADLEPSLFLSDAVTERLATQFRIVDRTAAGADGAGFTVVCPGCDVQRMIEKFAPPLGQKRALVHYGRYSEGPPEVIPGILGRGQRFWVEIVDIPATAK
ncbi:hypothetical protein B0H63DRAFT_471113 [Podospora didyma]|uniref:Uncharacterized protein n=1 Tax=Podospora didyma TaxID=330526 RepID=A0AAE0U288_9PEZI|nr:hypothetical protein B0H63DRAFT_471113 [Podospora didyma]